VALEVAFGVTGLLCGLAIGRWIAAAAAAGAVLIAWIVVPDNTVLPDWVLGFVYGGLTAGGVVLGVLLRRSAGELRGNKDRAEPR
jgi:hypothetical protein